MRETGPRLRDLGRWCSGGTPPKDVPELWSGEIPWISGKDFNDIRLRTTTDAIPLDAARSYSAIVPPGSLVMLVRGMALVHGLPVAQVYERTAINQDVRGLVLRPEFDPRFIHYALLAARPRLSAHVDRAAHGTARFVDGGYDVHLADPRAVDQEAIADFLDRECERIAFLVRRADELIYAIRNQAAEQFDRLVTDEIATRRKLKYSLMSIEQGWSPDCEARRAEPGQVGVLKVGAVNYGAFHADEHKALPVELAPRPSLFVHPGDVLMSRANTRELVGATAVVDDTGPWDLMLCDKLYRLHLRPGELDPLFATQALNSPSTRAQIEVSTSGASSSMQNISQHLVKSLLLPAAPLDKQRALARTVAEANAGAAEAAAGTAELRARLGEYRDALITEAVTGKLDVARLSDAQLDESARAALEGEPPEVLAS